MKATREKWSNEKLFSRLLNNKSERHYWDIMHELRKRPTKEVFDTALGLTHSEDKKAKQAGIHVLAQLGSAPRPFCVHGNQRFFDLLELEKDFEILESVLISIGHNNERLSAEQIEHLCRLVDAESSDVKYGLVFSLLGINDPKAIDALIILSSDESDNVRDWATFGIGTQTKRNNRKIREALWARVNDSNEETKFEAFVGLAMRKDSRINELIKQKLNDGDYGSLLFDAIIAIDGKEFLPLLKVQFAQNLPDKTINPSWLKDLKNCIDALEENGIEGPKLVLKKT